MQIRRTVTLLAAVLAVTACAEQEPEADLDIETPQPAMDVSPELPDTTESAVWSYLQSARYDENWQLWPGKGRLYAGTEPHGMLLTTYVNAAAAEAVAGGGEFPEGAIIVKENYMPDSTLAAVTMMYKVADFDPGHADWFWAKHSPEGVPEAAGHAEGCQSCHAQAAGGDYVYTNDAASAQASAAAQ